MAMAKGKHGPYKPRVKKDAPPIIIEDLDTDDDAPEQSNDFLHTASNATFSDDDTVEIVPPAKSKAQQLKDTLWGAFKGQSSESEESAQPKAAKRNLQKESIDTLLPIFAIVLCWTIKGMLPSEYKPCGPTRDESTAIVAPIVRMISRRIKAKGKMTEDTVDLLVMVTAMAFYGERAFNTAQSLNLERQLKNNDSGERTTANTPKYQGASTRHHDDRNSDGRAGTQGESQNGHVRRNDHTLDDTLFQFGVADDRAGSQLMADVLQRDADGRREHGIN